MHLKKDCVIFVVQYIFLPNGIERQMYLIVLWYVNFIFLKQMKPCKYVKNP